MRAAGQAAAAAATPVSTASCMVQVAASAVQGSFGQPDWTWMWAAGAAPPHLSIQLQKAGRFALQLDRQQAYSSSQLIA